jgi:hypothetical protein
MTDKRGAPKARGNGDGTLYQLASGRWAWQITFDILSGLKTGDSKD